MSRLWWMRDPEQSYFKSSFQGPQAIAYVCLMVGPPLHELLLQYSPSRRFLQRMTWRSALTRARAPQTAADGKPALQEGSNRVWSQITLRLFAVGLLRTDCMCICMSTSMFWSDSLRDVRRRLTNADRFSLCGSSSSVSLREQEGWEITM